MAKQLVRSLLRIKERRLTRRYGDCVLRRGRPRMDWALGVWIADPAQVAMEVEVSNVDGTCGTRTRRVNPRIHSETESIFTICTFRCAPTGGSMVSGRNAMDAAAFGAGSQTAARPSARSAWVVKAGYS